MIALQLFGFALQDCEHVSKREEEFYSVRCTVADMKNLYVSKFFLTVGCVILNPLVLVFRSLLYMHSSVVG